MKSILIIGLGRFGQHLCEDLCNLGNDVMVVDEDETKLEAVTSIVTDAKIGDCTNEDVLRSLGVSNFDVVFVCIGTNFQSSLECTSLVKELGAKKVVSKANREIHAKFLLRNGADEVIYPDRDIAIRTAARFSSDNVFDYMELNDEFTVCEIAPMKKWINKTLSELSLPKKYGISVLGTKMNTRTKVALSGNDKIHDGEHLLIAGNWESISKVLEELGL
jgi:potassium uptake protein ktrA